MKLELYYKTKIEPPRLPNGQIDFDAMGFYSKHMDKVRECSAIKERLEEDKIFVNKPIIFGSDKFYKLLDAFYDKCPLKFIFVVKFTKKEASNFKAFHIKPQKALALKYSLVYNDKKDPFYKPICFPGEKEFQVCRSLQLGLYGQPTFKQDSFAFDEYRNTEMITPKNIRMILESEKISGFHFDKVGRYPDKYIPDVYTATADNTMKEDFLGHKLCKISYSFQEEGALYYDNDGSFIYPKGALDDIKDFSYTRKAIGYKEGSMICSYRFFDVYNRYKLKGLRFSPVFEVESDAFSEYNLLITSLAKEAIQYDPEHRIGLLNELKASELVDGVL